MKTGEDATNGGQVNRKEVRKVIICNARKIIFWVKNSLRDNAVPGHR
jgi:hypothetical protein